MPDLKPVVHSLRPAWYRPLLILAIVIGALVVLVLGVTLFATNIWEGY